MSRAWRNLGLGIIIAVVIIALTPYVWMFLTSIKTRVDALTSVPKWLFSPTFEHYPKVFLDKEYLPQSATALSLPCPAPCCHF